MLSFGDSLGLCSAVPPGSATLSELTLASELYRSPEVMLDHLSNVDLDSIGGGEHNRVRDRAGPTPCLPAPGLSIFRRAQVT